MRIHSIKYSNFRCFDEFNLSFNSNLSIIQGLNASGKSSVLEGIQALSTIKSSRTSSQKEMISYGESYSLIEGMIKNAKETEKVCLYIDQNITKIKKNDFIYKRLSDYIGEFNVVMFSALDFLVLKGGPKDRRRMFDLVFCQISKEFVEACNYYKKILKERNALLKRLIFENKPDLQCLLDVYSEQLSKWGTIIIELRIRFTDEINLVLSDLHKKISGTDEDLTIKYIQNVQKDELLMRLNSHKNDELKQGITLFGPHKDDFNFLINNKDASVFASQGQQRNSLLSLRLSMAEILFKKKNDEPIVLLDDVFSELDRTRQNALLENLNKRFQTIITTSSISDIDDNILKDAEIIEINHKGE